MWSCKTPARNSLGQQLLTNTSVCGSSSNLDALPNTPIQLSRQAPHLNNKLFYDVTLSDRFDLWEFVEFMRANPVPNEEGDLKPSTSDTEARPEHGERGADE